MRRIYNPAKNIQGYSDEQFKRIVPFKLDATRSIKRDSLLTSMGIPYEAIVSKTDRFFVGDNLIRKEYYEINKEHKAFNLCLQDKSWRALACADAYTALDNYLGKFNKTSNYKKLQCIDFTKNMSWIKVHKNIGETGLSVNEWCILSYMMVREGCDDSLFKGSLQKMEKSLNISRTATLNAIKRLIELKYLTISHRTAVKRVIRYFITSKAKEILLYSNKKKQGHFFKLPFEIFSNYKVCLTDIAVLSYFFSLKDSDGVRYTYYGTQKMLGDMFGLGYEGIKSLLERLTARGYLLKTPSNKFIHHCIHRVHKAPATYRLSDELITLFTDFFKKERLGLEDISKSSKKAPVSSTKVEEVSNNLLQVVKRYNRLKMRKKTLKAVKSARRYKRGGRIPVEVTLFKKPFVNIKI